jgi:hypothetical protein
MRYGLMALLLCVPMLMGNEGGCSAEKQPITAAERQSIEANKRVDASTTENNEAANIEYKRITMGKPGLVGYVVLLSQNGTPVQYFAVKGKCTSGNKRLTQAKRVEWLKYFNLTGDDNTNTPTYYGSWEVVDGPSEDGTYGQSSDYIFCHTTGDAYIQWNGLYLYSTQPFDLNIKPLVVDLSTKTTSQ